MNIYQHRHGNNESCTNSQNYTIRYNIENLKRIGIFVKKKSEIQVLFFPTYDNHYDCSYQMEKHPNYKQKEPWIIFSSYTIMNPIAMMIKFINAFIANFTVASPRLFLSPTIKTQMIIILTLFNNFCELIICIGFHIPRILKTRNAP